MRIAAAADHAGFELKNLLVTYVSNLGLTIEDLGATEHDPADDYPDFAERLGRAVGSGKADRGILICGSGVGASIAANKLVGVRAGLCHDTYSARQGVEHDDMNVLVLGSRIIGEELARELVKAFLHASFSNEARHERRLKKVLQLERDALR